MNRGTIRMQINKSCSYFASKCMLLLLRWSTDCWNMSSTSILIFCFKVGDWYELWAFHREILFIWSERKACSTLHWQWLLAHCGTSNSDKEYISWPRFGIWRISILICTCISFYLSRYWMFWYGTSYSVYLLYIIKLSICKVFLF